MSDKIVVFKVRPESGMTWLIGEGHDWIKYQLEQMNTEDFSTLEIKCEEMLKSDFENVSEHGGW